MAENEKVEQSVPSAPKADKAKKDKKSDKKSKPGVFARIGRWFRELKIELKKVVWPTGKQTVITVTPLGSLSALDVGSRVAKSLSCASTPASVR